MSRVVTGDRDQWPSRAVYLPSFRTRPTLESIAPSGSPVHASEYDIERLTLKVSPETIYEAFLHNIV